MGRRGAIVFVVAIMTGALQACAKGQSPRGSTRSNDPSSDDGGSNKTHGDTVAADGGDAETGRAVDAAHDASHADPAICSERAHTADVQLQQAISEADRNCAEDAECVDAPDATDCSLGCGGGDVVSTTGATQVRDAIDAINADTCAHFASDGCKATGQMCHGLLKPACWKGKCQRALTCDDLSGMAAKRLQPAIAIADKSCSADADCVLDDPGFCGRGSPCPNQAFSTKGVAQIRAALDVIDADLCPALTAACANADIPFEMCPAPPTAMCVQGQCSAVRP
jgi:hypothetical protein